ncbi:hypothetical protein PR048_024501 [Dryococelus australis]|uniref:Uncharacterized protein n=1 Tax=Dryococelus australis TaxID=614101 RepID=A0ABQ9GNR8_9NEOP|nr:hypothetical protein PR048_024501 [Dryococelus australis]
MPSATLATPLPPLTVSAPGRRSVVKRTGSSPVPAATCSEYLDMEMAEQRVGERKTPRKHAGNRTWFAVVGGEHSSHYTSAAPLCKLVLRLSKNSLLFGDGLRRLRLVRLNLNTATWVRMRNAADVAGDRTVDSTLCNFLAIAISVHAAGSTCILLVPCQYDETPLGPKYVRRIIFPGIMQTLYPLLKQKNPFTSEYVTCIRASSGIRTQNPIALQNPPHSERNRAADFCVGKLYAAIDQAAALALLQYPKREGKAFTLPLLTRGWAADLRNTRVMGPLLLAREWSECNQFPQAAPRLYSSEQAPAYLANLYRTPMPASLIWAALDNEVLTADEGEMTREWSSGGIQWRGKAGDPLGNPSTSGIVRHDSHLRKSGIYRGQPIVGLTCLDDSEVIRDGASCSEIQERARNRPRSVVRNRPIIRLERSVAVLVEAFRSMAKSPDGLSLTTVDSNTAENRIAEISRSRRLKPFWQWPCDAKNQTQASDTKANMNEIDFTPEAFPPVMVCRGIEPVHETLHYKHLKLCHSGGIHVFGMVLHRHCYPQQNSNQMKHCHGQDIHVSSMVRHGIHQLQLHLKQLKHFHNQEIHVYSMVFHRSHQLQLHLKQLKHCHSQDIHVPSMVLHKNHHLQLQLHLKQLKHCHSHDIHAPSMVLHGIHPLQLQLHLKQRKHCHNQDIHVYSMVFCRSHQLQLHLKQLKHCHSQYTHVPNMVLHRSFHLQLQLYLKLKHCHNQDIHIPSMVFHRIRHLQLQLHLKQLKYCHDQGIHVYSMVSHRFPHLQLQ